MVLILLTLLLKVCFGASYLISSEKAGAFTPLFTFEISFAAFSKPFFKSSSFFAPAQITFPFLNNNKVKVDKDLLEEVRSFFLGKKKKPESDIIENYNMDKTLYDDIETIERKKIQKHDNCREFNFEYK